jgi:hypothetical protein
MNKTTEALKLAAKALSGDYAVHPDEALAAIREALAEPEITTPDVCGEVCARAKLCYGCGKAFDGALAKPVNQGPVPYVDSTPYLHVGDSSFEGWYQTHPKACGGDKQLARDAYAAGMGDPLVAPVERQWVDLTDEEILECAPINGATVESVAIAVAAKLKEKNTPPVVQQGEPVAWVRRELVHGVSMCVYYDTKCWDDLLPLYTTPQVRSVK